MAKKRTTIFRQLVLTVLIPVILLITGLSIYNFQQEKEQIEKNRDEIIQQLQAETVEYLEFFDITLLELEKDMSSDAKQFSEKLVYDIFKETDQIETADLDSIKQLIGMTERQDIYIINSNGVVVNTTQELDIGLDFFSKWGEYFIERFNAIWQSQEFTEDRISIERSTRLPKKYTYHSTLDTNYIVELGMYNEASIKLSEHLIDKFNNMPNKYEEIDTVTLYFGTTYFMTYQGHEMRPEHRDLATKTLKTKESTKAVKEINDLKYTTEFHYLPMEQSFLHDGYVLRVTHNDQKVRDLIWSELKSFVTNLLLFVLPIFMLILWRARRLSKPISTLVTKIDSIQKNKALHERVPVVGNNEVTELGLHFNEMVSELQESYETLEQKVADRTREVVEQKEIIEEVYHEIQDSITYAQRLQQAILPKLSEVEKCFKEYFILFKPKDIVSGDFYWFEHKDGISYIASADCTGHGVPGAMVSVVCSNALNQSLNEFKFSNPSDILNKTRDLVIETFSKSGENVKDGMDIALCAFDHQKQLLHYSGANNPLWIVRKNEYLTEEQLNEKSSCIGDEFSLIETKADKQPVGLYAGMTPFEQTTIELKEGDTFYFFTDGYADQFGGEKGKKLKYRPFKQILLDSSKMSLSEQFPFISNSFEEWKGQFDQVDDVCVIGVRL